MASAAAPGSIVVVGGINMDLFIEGTRLPRPGETLEGRSFATGGGGKGANQAVAAARLAGRGVVELVGQVGDDVFGRELLAGFQRYGVGSRFVRVDRGAASGVALIFIDAAKENYVLPVYGANAACGGRQIEDAERALEVARVLLVQQEIPLDVTHAAMRAARQRGATVVLDPAPVRDLPEGFVECADIVTPNQIEAEALTGVAVTDLDSAARAAAALRRRCARAAIVKLGEQGAYVDSAEATGHFPAFPARPVATVAAGDAFAGGLAVGLAEGQALGDAVRLANATSAISVARPGAQGSMPARRDVDALMAAGCPRRSAGERSRKAPPGAATPC